MKKVVTILVMLFLLIGCNGSKTDILDKGDVNDQDNDTQDTLNDNLEDQKNDNEQKPEDTKKEETVQVYTLDIKYMYYAEKKIGKDIQSQTIIFNGKKYLSLFFSSDNLDWEKNGEYVIKDNILKIHFTEIYDDETDETKDIDETMEFRIIGKNKIEDDFFGVYKAVR